MKDVWDGDSVGNEGFFVRAIYLNVGQGVNLFTEIVDAGLLYDWPL